MSQRKSRLSGRQRNRLVEHFVAGTTARAAAELVGVNRNTAVSFFNRLRMIIAEELMKASPPYREKSKSMKVISVGDAKGNAHEEPPGKSLFSGS